MSVTDKKPWEEYASETVEPNDLKPWEEYASPIEKKNLVGNVSKVGSQTSKIGFEPFQTQSDTKTPSVLTPKGKAEYQEQVKGYVPPKEVKLPKEEKPDFLESIKNSLSNIGTGVQQFIPNTQIALSSTLEGLLGKDLGSDFYRNIVGSTHNPELDRQEAYAKLAELEPQFKKTRGLIESAENFDIPGLAAATVDAMSSLIRTAITSVPTAGIGLASDMVGGSIAAYNQEKAKSKGISVDELYRKGENEFAVPAAIGAVGTGLEAIGLKGTIGLINKKLTGSFAKKFATSFVDVNKEGLTEFTQTGLDAANKALAEGKSVADASKVAVDEMFSKKGLESYLMGAVGSAGSAGLGRVVKGMLPNNKKKATEATQRIAEMESELSNPNISPATQEFIAENIRQNVSKIADAVENDANEIEGLSDEQKFTINSINEVINSYEEVLSDPNASEQTKKLAQERISGLDLEVDNILQGKRLSSETQALVESKVPPQETPTIDTEEQIIAEGQQAQADFEATGDQVTYEQKMNELDGRANQLIETPTEITELEAQKADIEKTLYGTISGSIPLSQALPNGVYIDLGDGLFAYTDKNEKIAAIVDRNNNYLVNKSFWNATANAWQLPNQANLKDDAKKLGVDEATYIKKYKDAVDSLNAKYDAELAALENTKINQNAVQKQTAGQVPVQSEATVGEEVEGRTPESKIEVVAEKGKEEVIPKEKDTVSLPPRIEGGNPQNFEFSDGEWKQRIGKELTEISPNQQKQVNDAFVQSQSVEVIQPTEQVAEEVQPTESDFMQFFGDIVNESNTVDEAFEKVREIKGVPREVAKAFSEKYNKDDNLTQKEAFEKFYNEVKNERKTEEVKRPIETPRVAERSITDAFDAIEEAKRSRKTQKGKLEAGELAVKDMGDIGKKAIFIDNNFKDIVAKIKEFKNDKGESLIKIEC